MYLLRKITIPITKQFVQVIKKYSSNQQNGVLSVVSEQINATSKLKIHNWDLNLYIKPNDILDPTDLNTLRATLISNCPTSQHAPSIHFDIKDNIVTISSSDTDKFAGSDITCVLEVPVKSDLDINSSRDVHLEKLYSDEIKLQTMGNITTKNLQGFKFDFESETGNIHCAGNTLANQINIRTRDNGVCFWCKLFYLINY